VRGQFEDHLADQHSDFYTSSQLQAVVDRCERTKKSDQICPLCKEIQTSGRIQRHLGGHMQQIALFVPRPGEQDDAASNTESLGAEHNRSNEDSDGSHSSGLDFESNPSRVSEDPIDEPPDAGNEQQKFARVPDPEITNEISTDSQQPRESLSLESPSSEILRMFPGHCFSPLFVVTACSLSAIALFL
jgi:hypothetical protein